MNENIAQNRIEALRLVADDDTQIGVTMSLPSVWEAVRQFGDNEYHRLELSGPDRRLRSGVRQPRSATAPPATFQKIAQYDLATCADLAGLSQAAYQTGAKLTADVSNLGWKLTHEATAAISIPVGDIQVLDAHAFSAERIVGGKKEMVISFEGTNSLTDAFTDISTWGFDSYYLALRPALQTWLQEAIAHKDSYSKIYVTGIVWWRCRSDRHARHLVR